MSLLKLVRFPNLLIVTLTQFLLFELIRRQFEQFDIALQLDLRHFSYLVLVTVIITASGYIVNDILDLKIDQINKPKQVVIGKMMNLSTAYWLYFSFFLVGFILSLYLAAYVNRLYLLSIYPAAFLGLFLYSKVFKRLPLIGNLLVSLYCAGVGGILLVAEQTGIANLHQLQPQKGQYLLGICYWYMLFAFLSTMFREIVKDIEDQEGDRMVACRTAPIQWGTQNAKWIAGFFGLLLLITVPIMSLQIPSISNRSWTWVLITLFILLPTAAGLFFLWKAQTKAQFHQLSQLAKFIMFTGILFLTYILIIS